ncbi:aminopeptidase [Psychrosphaera saromensis]|uniref:Peptidase M28 n=1 Tax=Psychrosphaera saromensis TaxID=716813 RepID=A0A2S7UT40_9GAMM|nr:M28 family metallopeptidase [Psychrosphaera saromensis]PQJ52908.1 peptidase M28 [Psychrosphaera saromensis]GHB77996.1 aminopeptidase [Psychrosphaera saromensis]GLQ12937.1 aminopeptidase [Psychrosphaera saromensis]
MKLIKQFSLTALVASFVTVLAACSEQTNTASVEKARIQAHLEFLADDQLEGRDTGSQGYEIAANYVASEFKKIGLVPAGTDGYMQRVPFRRAFLNQNSTVVKIGSGAKAIELKYPQDYMMGANTSSTESSVKAEVVFVGYGLIAEDYNYDDYAGLDVEGKIVVALTGRPKAWPSEEGAHLGSGKVKSANAAKHGAIGFVTLHTPKREKVRSYTTSLNYLGAPSLRWLDEEDTPFGVQKQFKGAAYLNIDAGKKLFANAPTALEDIFVLDNEDKEIKGFDLNTSIELASKSRHEKITSPNVVAILPGSDPVLKDEYVVFTAHLDHIGLAKDVTTKDRINNGAMDNASGVSVLLETARVLANSERPRRSILFTVVTGEEKGLLGASYFANNPTVPLTSMIANVNLDMPVLLYDFADVIAFGANHSSLGAVVEKAAGELGIGLSPDPMPEQAIFTRSDHYNFVKKGIPAVFLMTGFTSKTEGEDGGKVWGEFFAKHYHKPSDSLDLPINYDAAKVFADVNIRIGLTIANQDERPYWLEDSFFGKTFGQTGK